MLKKLLFALVAMHALGAAGAIELKGVSSVNVTSDTAAEAKNKAFNIARREIIFDALRQYADVDGLKSALNNAENSELMNIISASSIDGEQFSDTTYAATISMTVDADAARAWLDAGNVQNWVPNDDTQDSFIVVVSMSDGMANWMELNKIARALKIDLGTQYISKGQARVAVPVSARSKFTAAVREAGWKYAANDGGMRIWK